MITMADIGSENVHTDGSGSEGPHTYEYYEIGIDVGAISTKVILLAEGKEVIGTTVRSTSMEPNKLVKEMVDQLLEDHDVSPANIKHIVATGQGRKAIGTADMARTEITAFSKGAHFLYPEARIAVDIGGQGIRVMTLGEMGIISDFRTNDKCSSGTGCFLDAMAIAMETDIEKMGVLSCDSIQPEAISTTCTVFAESEVISLVARGKDNKDIIAGLNAMVAKKIAALINATRSHGPVFLGGGVALNKGVIGKLREILARELYVPSEPQFVGALGAAILAPKPEEDDEDEFLDSEEEDHDQKAVRSGSILDRLKFWEKNVRRSGT